jgi:quercetin dioxygenase-like cupin family protein
MNGATVPARSTEMHEHGDDQSHCIISGKLELTVMDKGTFILEPGDRDFMPV